MARYLNELDGSPQVFSARSLAEIFDVPRGQKFTTTIGTLHRALQKAFSRGEVVAFVDEHGHRLREEEFTTHGSAAVEHPCIYGTPGTASPKEGFRAVTYDDLRLMQSPYDRDTVVAEEPFMPPPVEDSDDGEQTVSDDGDNNSCPADDARAQELAGRLVGWTATEPAPEWLPDDLLRMWVALPRAQARWRTGLDQAPMQERLTLIRAGVQRRGGDFAADSVTGAQMAALCRRNDALWEQCARAALKHYLEQGETVAIDDLPAFVEDPLTFNEAHDGSGAVLALTGAMLDLDPDVMELIADGAVEGIAEAQSDALEARLRHRAEALQYELDELREELRGEQEAGQRARGEATQLARELERLREDAQRAGSIDEQLATERAARQKDLARIADLEARVDSADADRARVRELTAQLQGAEQAQVELTARADQFARERELRAEAESQVQEQLRRVRDLTAQLRDATQTGVQLPIEDADALLRALGRPIGQAAGHAAGRLATGEAGSGDQRLLQLASAYGQLAIPAEPEADRPAPAPPVAPPGGRPAGAPADTQPANSEPADADAAAQPAAPEPAAEPPPDEASPDGPAEPPAAAEADAGPPAASVGSVRRRARPAPSPFTVRPIGGAEEIGGSAILVQTRAGASVLLDAGQRVKNEYGGDDVSEFHWGIPGVERLHGILVSHAHIDHVGSLPLVQQAHSEQQGSTVPVWMTEPTRDLTRIMLEDSAKIQHFRQQNALSLAESDFAPDSMKPAYTRKDVDAVLSDEVIRIAERAAPIPIPDTDLVAKFLPVSHVLGSCAIHLKDTATGATLLYTGDLGPFSDPQHTLPDFGGASGLESADMVIMESTYGLLNDDEREGRRRRLSGRERAIQLLADAAHKAIDRGGFVLLPSFSLGRTQEIATIIGNERGRRLPKGPIYLGGMGSKIITVYEQYGAARRGNWARPGGIPSTSSINSWLPEDGNFDEAVREILTGEQPGYVIASPAMVSGGWSRAFLREMAGDDRHAVVFTGYLPRHAGGIANLGHLRKGAQLRIPGEDTITIRSEWERAYGLSAHAPGRDLRKFAEEIARGRERVAFGTVHGEPEAQRELAAYIEDTIENATGASLQRNAPWPRRA